MFSFFKRKVAKPLEATLPVRPVPSYKRPVYTPMDYVDLGDASDIVVPDGAINSQGWLDTSVDTFSGDGGSFDGGGSNGSWSDSGSATSDSARYDSFSDSSSYGD